jgi:hypothetical protein
MHAACFDYPLQKWFDFKVPKTTVPSDFIRKAIEEPDLYSTSSGSKVIWSGKQPKSEMITKSKKGAQWEVMALTFQTKKAVHTINVEPEKGTWLLNILPALSINNPKQLTLQQVKADYEAAGLEDFELFWDNKPVNTLYKAGLLRV